jgi:hypothetical protein
MRTLHALLRLLVLGSIAACNSDFTLPPTSPSLQLHYVAGQSGTLPHSTPGATVSLGVVVTNQKGRPVKDVTVYWDDSYFGQDYLAPPVSLSDSIGIATTTWTLPALAPGQPRSNPTVRASLPGAGFLVFQIEVVPCTRC